MFRTFQVIRRETYIYLKELKAKLLGSSYSYDRKKDAFGGIEDNTVSLPNAALPAFGDAAMDVIDTRKMLKGDKSKNEKGTPSAIAADATLGRNACHFPPESWLRWRDHHLRARQLISGANDDQDLVEKANQAIGINAFGEHYLQDSYAAGHLINKGFVMAVAMEHVSAATKKARGIEGTGDAGPAEGHRPQGGVLDPVGGEEPPDRDERRHRAEGLSARQPRRHDGTRSRRRRWRPPRRRAPTVHNNNPLMKQAAQQAAKHEEMKASGLAPGSLTFEEYRTWLNDFWLQKITNTLHDIYCLKGLEVSSPDQRNLFRVYGDSSMIKSAAGAEYTARTSQMSRDAINALVRNKRLQLSGRPGAMLQVPTVMQILSRFPDRVVDDDGTEMSLQNWATGQPMRDKIEKLVAFFTKERWSEGKLTGVIKGLSVGKDVAPGLRPKHGPF